MIESAKQFSQKEILLLADKIEKQEPGLMPDLIKKAGELGFCGVDVPQEYGGLGLSKTLAIRILEMLSVDASFSVTLGVSTCVSLLSIFLYGNKEQKQQYIPMLSSGEAIGAFALSEPNAVSDIVSITTTATKKGTHYILNGTKMWTSNVK